MTIIQNECHKKYKVSLDFRVETNDCYIKNNMTYPWKYKNTLAYQYPLLKEQTKDIKGLLRDDEKLVTGQRMSITSTSVPH